LKQIAKKADWILSLIENVFLSVCFSTMVGIIFISIILQAAFRISIPWAQETALILMVWITCFGSSAAVRSRRHISLELMGRSLSPPSRRRLEALTFVVSAGFCLAACWMGAGFVSQAYKIGSTSLVLRIPSWIIYTALPVAAVMLTIRFIILLLNGLETGSASDKGTKAS